MVVVDLPLLLALKAEAGRYKDRADIVELIKRNKLSLNYIEELVIPLIKHEINKQKIIVLHHDAMEEDNHDNVFKN